MEGCKVFGRYSSIYVSLQMFGAYYFRPCFILFPSLLRALSCFPGRCYWVGDGGRSTVWCADGFDQRKVTNSLHLLLVLVLSVVSEMQGLVVSFRRLLAWSLRHALLEHDSLQAYAYVLSIATVKLLVATGHVICVTAHCRDVIYTAIAAVCLYPKQSYPI